MSHKTVLNNGIGEKELLAFAWDIYYKCVTLISVDDKNLIDFDEAVAKELIKTTLHSKCFGGKK